jgi:hypothetical protein
MTRRPWMRALDFTTFFAFPLFLLAARAQATHPLPGPHFLACEARGDSVHLSWDELGISRELHQALLFRDGGQIAVLEPESLSHDDPHVPPGLHTYRLDIVSSAAEKQPTIASRSCEVDVAGGGITCEVFGGIAQPPQVVITWEPPSNDGRTAAIEVHRDGELVAELPAEATGYSEEPLAGAHAYTVIAVIASDAGKKRLVLGECIVEYEPPVIGGFIRADANGDESYDISDPIFLLLYLFLRGREPPCRDAADIDDSGVLDITDAIYALSNLFGGGPPPPAPFPGCGHDPTPSDLGCELYPLCFTPPPP